MKTIAGLMLYAGLLVVRFVLSFVPRRELSEYKPWT
jgi:hypothetical protein